MESTKKDNKMWHPHVYRTPPKSPTPFSIDDILKRTSNHVASSSAVPNLAHLTAEEWLRFAYYAMQTTKLGSNNVSSEESGRDSTESIITPTSANSNTTDDETQPLNLSLTTKKLADPYDHEHFIMEHKTGKNIFT